MRVLACLQLPEQFLNGSLSFHPIPCGTALFGHVTSGATCMHGPQSSGIGHTGDRVTLARVCQLPIHQSHGGPRLDSCSMGLAILSALVCDVV